MGHGMGVPSMGIYSYELYQFFGVDTIIRIGSAGGIGDDVKVRDVVIALGASTNSHFADQYRFPGQLCATADFRLLRDAVETAEAMGVRADVVQVFTADQFYWGDKPRWKEARQRLKDAGIKVMETGFYETEAPACGCGAKLDHRDFGPNGKIDRLTYYISVKPEDVARAKELLADLVKPAHVVPQ